jgi:hypothetical protein
MIYFVLWSILFYDLCFILGPYINYNLEVLYGINLKLTEAIKQML